MEIKENTNYLGSITFPDNPQDLVNIVVNYSKNDGITFEFKDTKSLKTAYNIITGGFSNNTDFTLVNCFQKSFNNNCYQYSADLLILNNRFQTKESLIYNRYKFISNGLSIWLNKPFWEENFLKSLCINETQYKIDFSFEKGALLSIGNDVISSSKIVSTNFNGFSFLEFSSIDKTKGFNIIEVFSFFENLFKLLTLLSGNNFSIDYITCFTDKPSKTEQDLSFTINNFPIYRKVKELKTHYWLGELFFKYDEIEEYLDSILKNWNAKEEYYHIIDLNLTNLINPYSSRNTHYINSFACFEGLNKHILSIEDPRKQIDFHKNLFELFYPNNFEWFKLTSKSTRNFLAHGKKKSNEYTFSDFELLYASKAFLMISRFLILKEFGIPEQLLIKKLEFSARSFRGLMNHNAYYEENLIDIPII